MSIKGIIQVHRTKMESAGLLRWAEAQPLSARTAAMRPSLLKVQAALAERPDRFAVVQPSPMSILFEYTLPKLEPVLVELGEERTEQIVSRLCEHGKAMIEEHGLDGSRRHLEELFLDLTNYGEEIRQEPYKVPVLCEDTGEKVELEVLSGIDFVIEAYRMVSFEGRGQGYLILKLKGKISKMEVDEQGMISIQMKPETNNSDLIILERIKNLQRLDLKETQVSDLTPLKGLASLRKLNLSETPVSDLTPLSGLTSLRELNLGRTQVSDITSLSGLTSLQVLNLRRTQISDDSLAHLKELTGLQRLGLERTQISSAGLEHICGLVKLQFLNLRGTNIRGSGLKHLAKMADLEDVDLSRTSISVDALEHLKGLPKLRTVNLYRALLPQISDELKSMLPGVKFTWIDY